MPTTVDELAELLDYFSIADEDVRDATGANIRTCQRWRAGRTQQRRTKYDRKLETLLAVLKLFKKKQEEPDFVLAWLRSDDNPALGGGNALQLIRENKFETVRRGASSVFGPAGSVPAAPPPAPPSQPRRAVPLKRTVHVGGKHTDRSGDDG